jgi:3-oxoacyl-[acyl-carrier-protein] synthase II
VNTDSRHSILVTGLGAVSPIGVGVGAYTRALRAGVSGVRGVRFEDDRIASSAVAACAGFDPSSVLPESELKRLPRLVPMGLLAAREACAMAGLPDFAADESLIPEARRVGLVLGTGGGGIDFTLEQAGKTAAGGRPSLWSLTNATHGNLAGELSIHLGLRGPSLCVSTGCASSSDAIGLALETLRSLNPGAPDAMVVVGADAHLRADVLLSMELLGVISPTSASRPFDARRDGFVLGEGAWALVLERESSAQRRCATPLAQMLGYAATCDAHHRVRPAADMAESARAMALAIEDAGLTTSDIEVVHYHGTGTRLNDELETRAVKLALGEAHARRVIGTSVKSMIGHPQGACGAAAVAATIAAMGNLDGGAGAFVPPTINLEEPDPACDLDYTPKVARETNARTALVNCLAFGAKNSALVVRVE